MSDIKHLLHKFEQQLQRETGCPVELFMRFKNDVPVVTNPHRIIDTVSLVLKLNWQDIVSPKRNREYVDARSIICHILRTQLNMTLNSIGTLLRRDHSSALLACNNYKALFKTDKFFNEKATLCLKACGIEETEINETK
ncbi:MAG: helix-turn-helix domain-containing protein [Bacteroidia bacterium]